MTPEPTQRTANTGAWRSRLPRLRSAALWAGIGTVSAMLVWAALLRPPANPFLNDAGPSAQTFNIEKGAAFRSIARDLQTRGLLRSARAFELLAIARSQRASLRSGEYEFSGSESAVEVLDALVSGAVKTYSLTLVEGWTLKQTLNAVWAHNEIERTLKAEDDTALARFAIGPGVSLEGVFGPNTYQYVRGNSDVDLLARAHAQLLSDLDAAWETRASLLPLQTPYEALILASIVEKETGLDTERARVAGVFINRLAAGMRLQSDPTTIYGLGEAYDGALSREQLRQEAPYNTYRIDGLPPTPIAMVGQAALQAVLQPERHDFLYFVADGEGGHEFSVTLAEHNAAVEKYRATLKNAP